LTKFRIKIFRKQEYVIEADNPNVARDLAIKKMKSPTNLKPWEEYYEVEWL